MHSASKSGTTHTRICFETVTESRHSLCDSHHLTVCDFFELNDACTYLISAALSLVWPRFSFYSSNFLFEISQYNTRFLSILIFLFSPFAFSFLKTTSRVNKERASLLNWLSCSSYPCCLQQGIIWQEQYNEQSHRSGISKHPCMCVCVCTVMYKHKMRLVTWDIEAVQAGSWLNWWSDVLHQRLLYRYVSPVLHTLHGDSTCLIALQNNGLKIIAQQLLFVQNWKEQEPQLRSNGLHLYWFHFLVFEWSKSSFGGCFREKGGKKTQEKSYCI